MIDELKLSESAAEAIIKKAIKFEVYTDDMPDSKKDKIEAAHEVVAFAIDSWVDDGIRPDAEDEDQAKAGKMVATILEMAGVSIDDDDNIEYGSAPTDDDDDGGADGEAPFDINDVIEGYEELTAATRIKKIKALELDPEDDDDYNTLVGIEEWENAQDEPSSRVLSYLEDVLPAEGEDDAAKPADDDSSGDDDAEGESDGDGDDEPYTEDELNEMDKDALKEVASEFDVEFPTRLTDKGRAKVVASILEAQEESEGEGDNDGDGDEDGEPWDGYDESSIKEIKDGLAAAQEDEEEPLTAEQVQYVLDYEKANDNRGTLVKHLKELHDELSEGEGEPEPEDEPAEEEKPKGRRGRRGSKTADPDDSDDADEAKAKDDRKDAKKGVGGKLIITRDQILEALSEGEVEIELG